jgi:hypothetical protein
MCGIGLLAVRVNAVTAAAIPSEKLRLWGWSQLLG